MLLIFFSKKVRRLIIAAATVTVFFVLIYIAGKSLNKGEDFVLQSQALPVTAYSQALWEPYTDSLRALYGKNKQLIPAYELQILLALSHYPELRKISIHFYEEEALIPLASRPEPLQMLKPKQNWQYNVIISTKSIESLEPILVKNLPFEAQVGIIGHELAHTSF
jgi:hypothetical protein